MGMSIRNAEVEQLARRLASETGLSITETIRLALEHEAAAVKRARESATAEKFARVRALIGRTAGLPKLTDLSDNEILGYDDSGLPN